jgi:hypothetical protein
VEPRHKPLPLGMEYLTKNIHTYGICSHYFATVCRIKRPIREREVQEAQPPARGAGGKCAWGTVCPEHLPFLY